MRKIYPIITILLSTIFICIRVKAQDEYRAALPSVVPLSPNAAAMFQYVDYPVSHYSGVPDISIPLYEADIYGYKIPVTLSYHASGIRVSQEASWVGLGWSLNIGGAVSRTIKDTDDLYKISRNDGMIAEGYYHAPEIAGRDIMPPYNGAETDLYTGIVFGGDGIIKTKVDTEPDIFYYSFPGASGKFIIDKSRGPVLFDRNNNVKTELLNRLTNGQRSYYFKITATDGTRYIFDKEETTLLYSDNRHLNKNYTIANIFDRDPAKGFNKYNTSAWNLSKIILPNKKEIIFTYEAETITTPAQESLRTYYKADGSSTDYFTADGCGYAMGGRYSTSKSSTKGLRLTKISWDGGYIDFTAVARYDLNGTAKALSGIKVYDKTNTLVRQFGFEYSYFNNDYYNTAPREREYVNLRLKLNRVYEGASAISSTNKSYRFSYFEGTLPAKNSKNTDYWGYHNFSNYRADYCAKVNHYPKTLNGVLKTSNLQYLRIGTLNKVTLPTGGSVTYDYEENTFGNTNWAADNTNHGAGLRVKQITTEATTRKFTYTGGKLLIAPVLYCYDIVCPPGGRDRSPNCIVQLSEPKLPLSSFSNGNTVGYDKVEEFITSGGSTSKTVYEFYNNPEEELYEEVRHDFPTIPNYYNGLPKKVTDYANSTVVEVKEYKYASVSHSQNVAAFRWDPMYFSTFNYGYRPQTVRKTQETIRTKSPGQTDLVITKQFNYNNYYRLSSSVLTLDATAGESQEQITYYPTDFSSTVCNNMVTAHLIGVPVETIGLRDGLVVAGKKTEFKQVNGIFVPHIIYTLDTDVPRAKTAYTAYYNPKLYFDLYNSYGKPVQVRDNGISIVYIWSYNGQYPVAEIKNAAYTTVRDALGGETAVNNLENRGEPTTAEWTALINLQTNTNLKEAHVEIIKYKPLYGIQETTDLRGVKSSYEYDSFGRLINAKDYNGRLLRRYFYNYRTQ